MASFFSPTFLNDFFGHLIRFEFGSAITRVATELKYHHSHSSVSKDVSNSVDSLLHAMQDFAAATREQYATSRVSTSSPFRTVGLRRWHFECEPLVALGQVSESRRLDLEREDLSHSMFGALSVSEYCLRGSGGLSTGGSGSSRNLGSISAIAAQSVSLALTLSVLSEEFRSQAATFDEYGKNLGTEYRFLPDTLRDDFRIDSLNTTASQSVFTSQPVAGTRRSNSPSQQGNAKKTSGEKDHHTLSGMLLDIAMLLNMRSQVLRVYDWLASGVFNTMDTTQLKEALKELSALTGNILRVLDVSLQSEVFSFLAEHDKFECSLLNHALCCTYSLLDLNCIPALLSLYTAHQVHQDWKKFYAGLIGEHGESLNWSDNRVLTFLGTWTQSLAAKTSFMFHSASLQSLGAAKSLSPRPLKSVPFVFKVGANAVRPSSCLPGYSTKYKHESSSSTLNSLPEGEGIIIDVGSELNRLVELAGCVVSAAVLLNSTKDTPFDSAGYTCWVSEDARELPSGLESWFPLIDAPKGSFDRKFVIDFSMLFYQILTDLSSCRPCATQVSSVTDLTLDVIIQKVSPAEELYVVVLINPLLPLPPHVKAKNFEAYRKSLVSSVQQFTDSLSSMISLKYTFNLLKGPSPK